MQGDRALGTRGDVLIPFFGAPAPFPLGPFRPRAGRRGAARARVLPARRELPVPVTVTEPLSVARGRRGRGGCAPGWPPWSGSWASARPSGSTSSTCGARPARDEPSGEPADGAPAPSDARRRPRSAALSASVALPGPAPTRCSAKRSSDRISSTSEFVCRLVLGIARESGIATALAAAGNAAEIAARAGLRGAAGARCRSIGCSDSSPRDGWIAADPGTGRIAAIGRAESCRCSTRRRCARSSSAGTPSWMPAYVLAETVARDYPAFLRGEATGEDVLFAPRRLRLWVDYFSNDNGLYAVNNRVGAVAVAEWLPGPGSVDPRAGRRPRQRRSRAARRSSRRGTASATSGATASPSRCRLSCAAASRRCGTGTRHRRVPELRRARHEPAFGEQGVAPASVSVVYAVNTLHAAHDLGFTLGGSASGAVARRPARHLRMRAAARAASTRSSSST